MLENLKSKIRAVPDWPKPGIMFRDITTLLKDADSFKQTIDLLVERYKDTHIDKIAGIESRGFIFGAALAYKLGIGFVPVRKKGKLPAIVVSEEYILEYGTDKIEIHEDAITPNENVLIVDDLIATGGTAMAACNLIKKIKGNIVECCFIIDLPDLGGMKKLEDAGNKAFALLEFSGE
ncbi:MAG: adenine phosphoribosyltransferase [Candidatus Magasanikbacteria bacterium]|jgi:adenine phosphoribosyltransferase